jgi:hypothetical protein
MVAPARTSADHRSEVALARGRAMSDRRRAREVRPGWGRAQHQVGLADDGTDPTEVKERPQWRRPTEPRAHRRLDPGAECAGGENTPRRVDAGRTCPMVTTRDGSGGHRLRCRGRWW